MKPSPGHLALIAVLYYGGAKLGMLGAMPEGGAILWPANAVVLAALLRFNGAGLAAIGAVVVATEVVADVPTFTAVEALLFGLVNFGEAAGAFFLLRRLRFDARFAAPADLGKFLLAGPLAAGVAAALLGAAVYNLFRGGDTGYLQFALSWWRGDALGLLVFTPLFLGFAPFRTLSAQDGAPPAPFAGTRLALAAGLAAAAAWSPAVPSVLALLAVLYVALRYPLRWTAVAVAGLAALLVAALLQGRAPFGALAPQEAVLHAQQFIFVSALLGLACALLVGQLRAQRALLEERVQERTRELQAAHEELARLATLDPLTGVGNRRLFDELLEAETARAQRYGGALSLVLADLDYFRDINDTHGQAVGDQVLQAVAAVLRQAARGADIVARYGGEEFAVILPQTVAAQAVYFAERARRAVAQRVPPPPGKRVTVSLGVAELRPGATPAQLLQDAEDALYRAKQGGRDRVARADRLVAL